MAGSTAAASWLHNRSSGSEETATVRLGKYDVSREPSAVEMAIVHGSSPHGTSIDKMVRAAVGEMGGMSKLIDKGDVVVVKPNVAFDRGPELAATTHPETLKAVITLCREAGAKKILVADNPINSPEGCFHRSGIQKASEEAGATVLYPRPRAFRELEIGGRVLGTWPAFYEPFEEATKVIGVAPLKDHNLCGASMTMKNWYGLLGSHRNRFHQKIHDVIADLAFMVTPTLVFLDATRILMSNGPTGGSLSDVARGNTLVCGVDPVAVDAYGFTLLGRDPEALDYLGKAHARGIGNKNWKSSNWREMSV